MAATPDRPRRPDPTHTGAASAGRARLLSSGARARVRGAPDAPAAVVILGGGTHRATTGSWGGTPAVLLERLSARLPHLAIVQVRYRAASTRDLAPSVADARAAVADVAGDRPCALVGFSMGGAVAVAAAAAPTVVAVVGLAPWLPPGIDLSPLRGRDVTVIQGRLDTDRWGLPGVDPAETHAACARMRREGIRLTETRLRWATHGPALPLPGGRHLVLPGARHWIDATAAPLAATLPSGGR